MFLASPGVKQTCPTVAASLITQVSTQLNFGLEGTCTARQAIKVCIRRRANGGQHQTRNAKEPKQFIVPIKRLEIEEHRAAGICHIRDVHSALSTASQVPDKPRVDVAEEHLSSFSSRASAVDVLEDPLNLSAGKISCRWQSRLPSNHFAGASLFQVVDDAVGARVLPDDGVVKRLAGLRVPDDRGLALVGDADRHQVLRGEIGF